MQHSEERFFSLAQYELKNIKHEIKRIMNPFHCVRFIVPNTTDNSSLLFIELKKKNWLKSQISGQQLQQNESFFSFFFDAGVKMCPC